MPDTVALLKFCRIFVFSCGIYKHVLMVGVYKQVTDLRDCCLGSGVEVAQPLPVPIAAVSCYCRIILALDAK